MPRKPYTIAQRLHYLRNLRPCFNTCRAEEDWLSMEEPSLDVVLKALDALFRKDDTQEKEQASRWLTQLQGSVGHLLQVSN